MNALALAQLIDSVVSLGTLVANAAGEADAVGAIIAQRIKDGRMGWSQAELDQVEQALQAAKARAQAAATAPDTAA